MGKANSTLLRLSAFFVLVASFSAQAQTVTTFEGMDATQLAKPEVDFDPNGAVGTKQYMEWVDTYYQAWSKTSPFAAVWPKPLAGATPFSSLTQCSSIQGDGIINFDRLASRWIIAAHNQLTSTITAYYYCVAISNTDDLSSTSLQWYTYAFPLDSILGTNAEGTLYFPDWPKIGTWSDAYYLGMDYQDVNNGYQEEGVIACALDRTDMLVGATALTPQCFKYPTTINGVYLGHSLQPADVEGTTPPPSGAPEYFVSIENPVIDGVTTTSDTFNLWQFHVDWSNPANTTFSQSTLSAPVYTPGCYNVKFPTNTVCVPEPSSASTGQDIDSVGDRFMWRLAYRNFSTYQSYLVSHTVQVGTGALSQTGIRWYELRGNGVPTIFQSGTVSPDSTNYRFMPSITQDMSANAAVGYSVSSASTHPSISASYWNLTTGTAPTEISLYQGTADEENSYKWGDYTSMTVDPVNGCTFWYVNEYFTNNQIGTGKPIWQTRISNFSLPTCGAVNVSPTSLTFGPQAVGTTSASQTVTLTNSQPTALTINNIFGNGTNSTDFGQSNDCGNSVPAGLACTININFTPSGTGTRTANLVISDSASNSPQTVTLTGTGTSGGATISLSPGSINFGNQAYGTTSAASAITVSNTGTTSTTFTSIGVTGANAANFGESNNCGSTLAVGGTCTINVTFNPTAATTYSAAVTLTDNAGNSPQSATLAGTGVAPVTLSATSLGFGMVLVDNTSTAPAVTLTNVMPVALTGISIVASGTGYAQTNTCGTSIAAGKTCKISVTFAPTVAGAVSGSITITDSAASSPQTITLTGTGLLPVVFSPVALNFGTVTIKTTSVAKSVTMTNNAKTSLTIDSFTLGGTDPGDFTQTATTCGATLAAGANCSLSYTFTPAKTGPRSATVTVTDSAKTSPQTIKLSGTGAAAAVVKTK